MNLVEQLNKTSRFNEPLAWQEYYAILRDGRIADHELPKLKDLMFSLGKTRHDLEIDLGAVARFKELRATIDAGAKLSPAIDENAKQRAEQTKRADALRAQLDGEMNVLLEERQRLTARRDDAKEATASLQKLFNANPAMFHSERFPELEDLE